MLSSSHFLHLSIVIGKEIFPFVDHLTRNDARMGRQKAARALWQSRFSTARLSDDAENFPFIQFESDSSHSLEQLFLHFKSDVEVFNSRAEESYTQPRVKGVAQSIAEEIEAEHGDADESCREKEAPRDSSGEPAGHR